MSAQRGAPPQGLTTGITGGGGGIITCAWGPSLEFELGRPLSAGAA